MSEISQKSISGITSITTPAGVDNQFTVHTNDSTEKFKITSGGVNVTGVITATQFKGDGSELTGVSGFSTALSNDTSSLLNQIFKTNREASISETILIQSDAASGNMAFTRLNRIDVVGSGVLHIGAGTTFKMNVLDLF